MSNHLVGKTIAKVRTLTEAEMDLFYLDAPTEVIEFTDGTLLVALADPEGNGPGQLIYSEGKTQFYVTADVAHRDASADGKIIQHHQL